MLYHASKGICDLLISAGFWETQTHNWPELEILATSSIDFEDRLSLSGCQNILGDGIGPTLALYQVAKVVHSIAETQKVGWQSEGLQDTVDVKEASRIHHGLNDIRLLWVCDENKI